MSHFRFCSTEQPRTSVVESGWLFQKQRHLKTKDLKLQTADHRWLSIEKKEQNHNWSFPGEFLIDSLFLWAAAVFCSGYFYKSKRNEKYLIFSFFFEPQRTFFIFEFFTDSFVTMHTNSKNLILATYKTSVRPNNVM